MTPAERPVFFSFKPNVFSGRFFFWFGNPDPVAIRKWYESFDVNDERHGYLTEKAFKAHDEADWGAICVNPFPAHPVLIFHSLPKTAESIGTLVHEVHHAVQRFGGDLGIFTSRESEEFYAYLEGRLVEVVLDYVWNGTAQPGLKTET